MYGNRGAVEAGKGQSGIEVLFYEDRAGVPGYETEYSGKAPARAENRGKCGGSGSGAAGAVEEAAGKNAGAGIGRVKDHMKK